MGSYYMALLWINVLLVSFLTPLFLIPGTWVLDMLSRKRNGTSAPARTPAPERR
ncbi:MAG TPA: hypothetical protein VGE02_13140 [Gemmatimonadales bacterium]